MLKKQNKVFLKIPFYLTYSPAPQRQNELIRKHPSCLSQVQICLNLHHCLNTIVGETESSTSCHQVYLNYKLLKNN